MFHKTASLLLVFAISASAATIVVDTTDRGYYYSSEFSDSTNKNYLTGQLNFGAGTDYYHSFFAFGALSGLTGPIVSATLTLFNPAGGYSSTQASETLMIDGFSGNVATLDGVARFPASTTALAAESIKKWALPTIKTRNQSPSPDDPDRRTHRKANVFGLRNCSWFEL